MKSVWQYLKYDFQHNKAAGKLRKVDKNDENKDLSIQHELEKNIFEG